MIGPFERVCIGCLFVDGSGFCVVEVAVFGTVVTVVVCGGSGGVGSVLVIEGGGCMVIGLWFWVVVGTDVTVDGCGPKTEGVGFGRREYV